MVLGSVGRGKGGGDVSIRRRAKALQASADHRGLVLGISPPPPEHRGTFGDDSEDEDDEDDEEDDEPPLGGSRQAGALPGLLNMGFASFLVSPYGNEKDRL